MAYSSLLHRIDKQFASTSEESSSCSDSFSWDSDGSEECRGRATSIVNNVGRSDDSSVNQASNKGVCSEACPVPLLVETFGENVRKVEEIALNYVAEIDVPVINIMRDLHFLQISKILSSYHKWFSSTQEKALVLTTVLDFVSCCSQPGLLYTTYESCKTSTRMREHVLKLMTLIQDLLYSKGSNRLTHLQLQGMRRLIEASVNRLPVQLRSGCIFIQSLLRRKISTLETEEKTRSSFPMYDFRIDDEHQVMQVKGSRKKQEMTKTSRNQRTIQQVDHKVPKVHQSKTVEPSKTNSSSLHTPLSSVSYSSDGYSSSEKNKKKRSLESYDCESFWSPSPKKKKSHMSNQDSFSLKATPVKDSRQKLTPADAASKTFSRWQDVLSGQETSSKSMKTKALQQQKIELKQKWQAFSPNKHALEALNSSSEDEDFEKSGHHKQSVSSGPGRNILASSENSPSFQQRFTPKKSVMSVYRQTHRATNEDGDYSSDDSLPDIRFPSPKKAKSDKPLQSPMKKLGTCPKSPSKLHHVSPHKSAKEVYPCGCVSPSTTPKKRNSWHESPYQLPKPLYDVGSSHTSSVSGSTKEMKKVKNIQQDNRTEREVMNSQTFVKSKVKIHKKPNSILSWLIRNPSK